MMKVENNSTKKEAKTGTHLSNCKKSSQKSYPLYTVWRILTRKFFIKNQGTILTNSRPPRIMITQQAVCKVQLLPQLFCAF
jgi:hypothetical protein